MTPSGECFLGNEDPQIEIGRHIFVGSKASWEVIPDLVVQYAEYPPAGP